MYREPAHTRQRGHQQPHHNRRLPVRDGPRAVGPTRGRPELLGPAVRPPAPGLRTSGGHKGQWVSTHDKSALQRHQREVTVRPPKAQARARRFPPRLNDAWKQRHDAPARRVLKAHPEPVHRSVQTADAQAETARASPPPPTTGSGASAEDPPRPRLHPAQKHRTGPDPLHDLLGRHTPGARQDRHGGQEPPEAGRL